VACLPYPNKGQLVAAGVPPSDIGREAAAALDVICMDLAAQLQQFTGAKLLIGHATIAGATASTGQPLGLEHDIAMTATMLARFGPNVPLIFGHIHKPHTIYGTYYAGSISANDWGETEEKRYIVLDYDGAQCQIVSRQIDTPRLYHVEGLLTRDGFDWRCTKGPGGPADEPPQTTRVRDKLTEQVTDWSGCDVRVRFRYNQAERELLGPARERIRSIFSSARRLELEPVATAERTVRAPEVVQATTLDGKLRAWARLTDTAWSGEIERCAALLLANEEGEPVVAETEARLNPLVELSATVGEPALAD
jgi:DNA repair exonuclease SbcCD nuclease subunit